jgi:hypothetical protein
MKHLVISVFVATMLHASIVDKVGDACVVPKPEFGDENLSTGAGGVLAEWTTSINALPNGPVKTDLLNRLLNTVISPDSFFSDKNAMRAFLRKAVPPLYMRPPFQANSPFQGVRQPPSEAGGSTTMAEAIGASISLAAVGAAMPIRALMCLRWRRVK